jgi:hypothetical protein
MAQSLPPQTKLIFLLTTHPSPAHMPVHRTLLTAAALWLVVAVASGMVPRACAQGIVACDDGQQNGNISYSGTNLNTGAWGAYRLPCLANAITGLHSVTSFSYYVALAANYAPTQASGFIIDTSASNSPVASVNISHLLPTTAGEAQAVSAAFASPVALDPLHTYLLAFCATGEAAGANYSIAIGGLEVRALQFCLGNCTTSSGEWQLASSPLVLITDIIGSCISASASPSPSASPTFPPPPRSPTPSPSPSPAKGSADRLTPREALGAKAVRFVLELCTLLFD